MSSPTTLPEHLAREADWVEIEGFGWLLEVPSPSASSPGLDFWWWHYCPPMLDQPGFVSPRRIDCSSGERHAILSGSLKRGNLTIGGGSGSIPCDRCGLHGWVRDGKWVRA